MSQTDALKKYLDAGMAFTQLTRQRAEQMVKDLVAAGDLQRNQAKEAIDELVERSRKNADELAEQVRKEVDSQLSNLGLARKADLERLEAELDRLRGSGAKAPAEPAAQDEPEEHEPAQDRAAKPAETAKKVPAKKAGGEMAPVSGGLPGASTGTDEDDKPAPAKKAPAKKTPAKKAGGEMAPVSGGLPGASTGSDEDDKPAAAKKAPAKKTPAKKAGGEMAPVSGGLPGASTGSDEDDKPIPAKKASAKKAPAKKASADRVPVSGELPAKRAANPAKKQG